MDRVSLTGTEAIVSFSRCCICGLKIAPLVRTYLKPKASIQVIAKKSLLPKTKKNEEISNPVQWENHNFSLFCGSPAPSGVKCSECLRKSVPRIGVKRTFESVVNNFQGETNGEPRAKRRKRREKKNAKVKWQTLEHNGPNFPPPYKRLPDDVHFYYDRQKVKLSEAAEEAASFYGKMLRTSFASKELFRQNFFKDFRKTMTCDEQTLITNLDKCCFEEIYNYYDCKNKAKRKAPTTVKRQRKLEQNALIDSYGYCLIDGRKERIANYCVEPPGLFRGRGEHPKMGMIKKRVQPEDVTINCSANCTVPVPPEGHQWKEVCHNNLVSWLASWTDNISGQVKYVQLNAASGLKSRRDFEKFEVARSLSNCIEDIRATYRQQWNSAAEQERQLSVALYFIDRLALRTGYEKDEDQADTVGCCSLRVEHVTLHDDLDGDHCVVVLDFLGKDSIRYYNKITVEESVFDNLKSFMEYKYPEDFLFDLLSANKINDYLKHFMDGLSARVFRTYNASVTLQNQLDNVTTDQMSLDEKLQAYMNANRAVAILCNHHRAVPKGHAKSMGRLKERIRQKHEVYRNHRSQFIELQSSIADLPSLSNVSKRLQRSLNTKLNRLEKIKYELSKLEMQKSDLENCKEIALNTSKLNYLDPRISVAWCKRFGVPISKIYNHNLRKKFAWALNEETFRF